MARLLILIAMLVPLTAGATGRDLDKLYQKVDLRIGNHKLRAYVADDGPKREAGLMYIEKMPEDTGMLFVFEREQPLGFWMKNTLIPLSIGFFNSEGVLVDHQEMKVANSQISKEVPTYQSRSEAQLALEMNAKWFIKSKIKDGAKISLDSKTSSRLLKQILIRKTTKPSRL